MTGHLPLRPSWICAACNAEWPCRPAQVGLKARHNAVQVAMIMWTRLEQVAVDLPDMPLAVMFERFLRWTRRPLVRGDRAGV